MNKPLIKLFRSLPADDSKRHLFATDFSLILPTIYNLCRSFSVALHLVTLLGREAWIYCLVVRDTGTMDALED